MARGWCVQPWKEAGYQRSSCCDFTFCRIKWSKCRALGTGTPGYSSKHYTGDDDYPPIYLHLVGSIFDIELSKDGDSYVNHSWPSKGWDRFPRPQEVQFPFDKKNNFRVPCLVVSQTHTLVFVLLLVELEERRYERVGSSVLYCWSSALGGLSTFSEIEMIEGIDLRKEHFRLGWNGEHQEYMDFCFGTIAFFEFSSGGEHEVEETIEGARIPRD
jgi:hypothetical protein